MCLVSLNFVSKLYSDVINKILCITCKKYSAAKYSCAFLDNIANLSEQSRLIAVLL